MLLMIHSLDKHFEYFNPVTRTRDAKISNKVAKILLPLIILALVTKIGVCSCKQSNDISNEQNEKMPFLFSAKT